MSHRAAHGLAELRVEPSTDQLMGLGMRYADVSALRQMTRTGVDFADAAAALGYQHAEQAEQATDSSYCVTAKDYHLLASACFRAAYHALPEDDSRRIDWHSAQVAQFGLAAELSDPPAELLDPNREAGWLLRPAHVVAPAVVILVGEVPDCCESSYSNARHLLDRGLAAVLIDLPGHDSHTRSGDRHPGDTLTIESVLDRIDNHRRVRPSVGLWGRGLSGPLLALAAHDSRISACCVIGNTDGSEGDSFDKPDHRRLWVAGPGYNDQPAAIADWFSDRLYGP